MAKVENDVRVRLQRAALALFCEYGYDRTTAAEIAARAGVTERTFFRHFPDKREVLFDGERVLRLALTAAVADVPEALGPLDTLFRAFRSIVPVFEENRSYAKPRHEVIAVTPALAERELALAAALAEALRKRGVAKSRAELAARVGMAALVHAVVGWLDKPTPSLVKRLDAARRELETLLASVDA